MLKPRPHLATRVSQKLGRTVAVLSCGWKRNYSIYGGRYWDRDSGPCRVKVQDDRPYRRSENPRVGSSILSLALGKIRHIEITGDRAYIVAPVVFAYNLKGKQTKKTGVWTIGLQKSASAWLVSVWTYTMGKTEMVAEGGPAK